MAGGVRYTKGKESTVFHPVRKERCFVLFRLTPAESACVDEILRGYADNPHARHMKDFIQHGTITTYEHCMRVARIAFWLNRRLGLAADEVSLVRGAFLHDFYLYDWHHCKDITHWHGFKHPQAALYNAETVFDLNDIEKDCIRCHMWPLTLTAVPHTREAVLVGTADKISSGWETVMERRARRKDRIENIRNR